MRPIATLTSQRPSTFLILMLLCAFVLPLRAQEEARGDGLKPRWVPSKSFSASFTAHQDVRHLIIKMKEGRGYHLFPGGVFDRQGKPSYLNDVLRRTPGATLTRALSTAPGVLDAMRRKGEANTGQQLADLNSFYLMRVDWNWHPADLLMDVLALDEVENAYYRVPKRGPSASKGFAPIGPDLTGNQNYGNPAPEGIDIAEALARGLTGSGVTVCDVEEYWNLNHEDLAYLSTQTPPVPMVPESDWRDDPFTANSADHGTATLGVIAGEINACGIDGLARDATIRVCPILRISDPNWIAPDAVVLATLNLSPGDVMLLEVETAAGYPFETFDLEFAVVKQATALGIHVIEPAGNSPGGYDLDDASNPVIRDPATGLSKFDLYVRDSGAIMVGAGESATQPNAGYQWGYHNKYVNSNYGTRCDSYSWGQDVTTAGYGPASGTLANCNSPSPNANPGASGPDEYYTNCYNGTSAAASIIAAVAAMLEQKHVDNYGRVFGVRQLRNLMRMGTPGYFRIGHQPNMKYQPRLMDRGGIIEHLWRVGPRPSQWGSSEQLGSGVAAGDVDGDGVPDVLAGAPGHDIGTTSSTQDHGQVYCWSGATGDLLWTKDGLMLNDFFGASLANVGDLNGDGIVDFAVGAPNADSGGSSVGSMTAISGVDGATLFSVYGTEDWERFGDCVANAGDVDGDGTNDIIVGSPHYDGPGYDRGRATIVSGAGGAILSILDGNQDSAEFGQSVDGAGDQNGDGQADVIVGSPQWDDGTGAYMGRAFVLNAMTGATVRTYTGQSPPQSFNYSGFGAAVCNAGDLTRDGVDDLVIGAPGWSVTPAMANFGAAYVYRGGSTNLLRRFTGKQSGDALGSSVCPAGDFDGDGWLDIAVGSPNGLDWIGNDNERPGRVFVFCGPFTGPVISINPVPVPGGTINPGGTPGTGGGTGTIVNPGGTITIPGGGSGGGTVTVNPTRLRRDLVAIARPCEYVFWTRDRFTKLGHAVAFAGDVNGDGRDDIVAGGPYGDANGRVYVFARRPGPFTASPATLVSDPPVIEAKDTNGNGMGGGGLSPDRSVLRIRAGASQAFQTYTLASYLSPPFDTNPLAQALLTTVSGTLDGTGSADVDFGPFFSTQLCPIIGAEYNFVATIGTGGLTTNVATVTIFTEFPTCP